VDVRTTGHGGSAAAASWAHLPGLPVPDMLASSMGLRGAEIVAGVVCLVGLGVSVALPEPKGMSLEQLEAAAYAPPSPTRIQAAARDVPPRSRGRRL